MHDDSRITPAPTSQPVHPPIPPAPYSDFDNRHHPAQPVAPAPLAQQPHPPHYPQPEKKSNWKWWALGVVVVMEFVAPPTMKPTYVVGGIVAQWTRQIMAPNAEYQLMIAKYQKLAESIAQLEADYAHRKGQCTFAGALSPELGSLCQQGFETYYESALSQARQQLAIIEKQLGRR